MVAGSGLLHRNALSLLLAQKDLSETDLIALFPLAACQRKSRYLTWDPQALTPACQLSSSPALFALHESLPAVWLTGSEVTVPEAPSVTSLFLLCTNLVPRPSSLPSLPPLPSATL